MARITLSTHWKFQRLARTVGSKTLARGILETLWEPCWVAGDGYVGTSADIEANCEWQGPPGALTMALLMADAKSAGFIEPYEGPVRDAAEPHYQVHDFLHHCPEYVHRRRTAEKENTTVKVCAICGDEYFSRASWSKFCGARCRQIAHRENPNTDDETGPAVTHGVTHDDAVTHRVTHQNDAVTHGVTHRDDAVTHGENTVLHDKPHAVTHFDKSVTHCHAVSQNSLHTHTHTEEEKTLSDTTSEALARSEALAAVSVLDQKNKKTYQGSALDGTTGAETHDRPPPHVPLAAPVLTFPTVGRAGSVWHLDEAQLAKWQALYPHLELLDVARQALAWLLANPTRRRTADGMSKFLVAWFNRTVDSPRPRGSPTVTTVTTVTEPATDWDAFLAACPHTPKCEGIWRCDQLRRLAAVKGGG